MNAYSVLMERGLCYLRLLFEPLQQRPRFGWPDGQPNGRRCPATAAFTVYNVTS
jgi:hypothetical protein